MKRKAMAVLSLLLLISLLAPLQGATLPQDTQAQHDARMEWWREARFGLFIHWGLYAIPAGEWGTRSNHGEWIRTTAQIPIAEYEKFVGEFNPVKFNADEWVRMAKDAGMKYIVITSKHHDGFCLFDSKSTDFDVMSTPFHRDILKELAEACRKQGIKLCFYHSIMDWHHPDYLPRRDWEKDRPTAGANFDRYVTYMKNELKELLTNYGNIGVLWFDGEWESTWNTKYGRELYDYVRSLQPNIIINNRVGAGRSGMEGMTKEGEYAGDFGTPEQQIPATGLPGVDWETCMTMNDHWGYNKNDQHWKSSETLIRMLADIASKGGNFLLNVGPTAEGTFPQASVDRMREMGRWMKVNSESIYGTQASPFKKLEWGRATQKTIPGGTRLYLHVFDWPAPTASGQADGRLRVNGILNNAKQAYLLADAQKKPLEVKREEDALVVTVPQTAPDAYDSVVVLEVAGKPDISDPPRISAEYNIFVDTLEVSVTSERENVEVRYTTDGSAPSMNSLLAKGPIRLTASAVVAARCYRDGKPVSDTAADKFTKVAPRPGVKLEGLAPGIRYSYFEGDWDRLPDFAALKSAKADTLANFSLAPRSQVEHFGFEYSGYIRVPADGVYTFFTESDDGSRLYIGDAVVVDNDRLHGMQVVRGVIALSAGLHPIRVTFFQKTGGMGLAISYKGPGIVKRPIPDSALFRPQ